MKLKTLIVDDEYPARQELRFMLQGFKDIEIVGEATNAREALNLISALDYAVLFLDINMPGMNGLELSRIIQKRTATPPLIIFVTAYEKYALEAFEVNAVDYLLKPFDEERLALAIGKVRRLFSQQSQQPSVTQGITQNAKGHLNRLPIDKKGKTILLDQDDLVYAYTQKDNVYLKTTDEQYRTRYTLKELESRLDQQSFFRCHRCYIVNLSKIREMVPFFSGTCTLIMADQQQSEVPVSRKQSRKLKSLLGIN